MQFFGTLLTFFVIKLHKKLVNVPLNSRTFIVTMNWNNCLKNFQQIIHFEEHSLLLTRFSKKFFVDPASSILGYQLFETLIVCAILPSARSFIITSLLSFLPVFSMNFYKPDFYHVLHYVKLNSVFLNLNQKCLLLVDRIATLAWTGFMYNWTRQLACAMLACVCHA